MAPENAKELGLGERGLKFLSSHREAIAAMDFGVPNASAKSSNPNFPNWDTFRRADSQHQREIPSTRLFTIFT
jgi:hypothetical protein